MENASRALIMAAGVLMGILVLSLAIFLFSDFGQQTQQLYNRMDENKLLQYNSQYSIYAGREDITIYDIITVANLARENNNIYKDLADFEDEYKVIVGLTITGKYSEANLQNLRNKSNGVTYKRI